jgi:hypothetical protein
MRIFIWIQEYKDRGSLTVATFNTDDVKYLKSHLTLTLQFLAPSKIIKKCPGRTKI